MSIQFNDCAPADEPFGIYSIGSGKFIAKFCGVILHTGTFRECYDELQANGCVLWA